MAFRAFDHLAVARPVKQRSDLSQQPSAGFLTLFSVFEQISHLTKLRRRPVVADLNVVEPHIGYQNDLLLHIVKGDDLVEQHEVNVLERLAVLDLASYARLAVAEIIVGEIADQAACEGREI